MCRVCVCVYGILVQNMRRIRFRCRFHVFHVAQVTLCFETGFVPLPTASCIITLRIPPPPYTHFTHLSFPPLPQNHLKDMLTAVVSRRKAYRLRDEHFPYAFGSDVTPQPYLKNSLAAYHIVTDCPPRSASRLAGPPPQLLQDDAEQQAALLLACSGDSLLAPLPPISMFDLLEALQVHRGVMPSHTMYALNMERILSRLWHPSHEELEQDHVHRQRLAGKDDLLVS
uniref:Uncharacterized protein n=1 Tax=Hucho hucho TaxID=62062 RepID=A0A4W5PCG6_9TELE